MARARKASSGRTWFQTEIGRRNLKCCDRCSRFPCVHPDAGRSVNGLPDAQRYSLTPFRRCRSENRMASTPTPSITDGDD